MTTARAHKIVAALDQIEAGEPDISEDRLYLHTARVAHCQREDVSTALIITDHLENISMEPEPAPAFTLTPSPHIHGEMLLKTHDFRASYMAIAIGGRNVGLGEIHLTPGRAAKWKLLYEAGYTAIPKGHSWRYARNGDSRLCLSEAVTAAKASIT